jgi:hypothetical protein
MTTVQQVLVNHLHAIQREPPTEDDDNDNCNSSSGMDDRLRRVRNDLNECSMSRQLDALSILEKKGPDKRKNTAGSTNASATLPEQVSAALLHCCYCLLGSPSSTASSPSSSAVLVVEDALLDFMVSIAAEYNQMGTILDLATQASMASLERVRVMACRWLGSCAKQLVQQQHRRQTSKTGGSITSSTTAMMTAIRNLILPRLTDKAQSVRLAALQACSRISNDDESLTEAVLWNLHHDPSWANRCAALNSLSGHEHAIVVDHIIRRMRDVKTKVRLAAIAALHNVSMLDLTADQCAIMVRTGLTDRYVHYSRSSNTHYIHTFYAHPFDVSPCLNMLAAKKQLEL